jgi:aminoglycoside phosphotransferase (APT) family kinase protein
MLCDDRTWQHPLVRQSVDERLREDTLRLWDRAHRLLRLLDDLPQTLAHGDACPQNLLIEDWTGSIRFVAIDWGLTGTAPIGADLVQLIAGRAESGELDPREVPPIEHAILSAYRAGLAAEGVSEDRERIERGYRTQLAVRCGFTALPLERLQGAREDDPGLTLLFARRARWARMVLDRVPELEPAGT